MPVHGPLLESNPSFASPDMKRPRGVGFESFAMPNLLAVRYLV